MLRDVEPQKSGEPTDSHWRPILTGARCFDCTAGGGSSCGGAILQA
ncbi:MAG: DUF3641 domain-containing protein [Armatimonadetes bacterium]|nr:DUF3641 domain-containing protein [Armatimonadota bacterium]